MPAGALTAKIVGLFAIIGLGLGSTVLLFLWATGYFEPAQSDEFGAALGQAFFGGLAITAVLVFALLVGIVLAALAGVYAAARAESSAAAVMVGLFGSALGYAALVAALGLFMVGGIDALTPQPAPTPVATPAPTQSAQEIADCQELFGQGSPLCRDEPDAVQTTDETPEVGVRDVARLGFGLLPAALVGALSASLFASRRNLLDERAGRG